MVRERPLTPAEERCLAYVREHREGHGGRAPSGGEASAALGYRNRASASGLMTRLRRRGLIPDAPPPGKKFPPLTAERQALAVTCLRLAWKLPLSVRRLPAGLCRDDVVGAALVGLVTAAATYDADRDVQFYAWAELHVRRDVGRILRAARRANSAWRAPRLLPDFAAKHLADRRGDGRRPADAAFAALAALDEADRRLVDEAFWGGRGVDGAARTLGLTRDRGRRRVARALACLREALESEGVEP